MSVLQNEDTDPYSSMLDSCFLYVQNEYMKRFLPIFFTVLLLILATAYPTFSQTETFNVSGTIPPRATDMVNTLEALSDTNNLGSLHTTSYKITYGTSLPQAYDMTLTASWTTGTPSGGGASVDVLDYVSDSASSAYNNAAPILNTTAKTITWNIHALPGETSRNVTFALITKNLSTGTVKINFSVKSTLAISPTGVFSTVDGSYRQTQPSTATPTPTAAPSITPTIALTPTPTVTPIALFKGVSVNAVSSTSVGIGISTSVPAGVSLSYGTSPGSLTQKRSDPGLSTSHTINFSSLSPNTTYYFKVTAIDSAGKTSNSDLYTVKTAVPSIQPEVDLSTLIVTSNNNILASPGTAVASTSAETNSSSSQSTQQVVVIPQAIKYEFTFSLQGKQSVKSVRAVLRLKPQKIKKTGSTKNPLSFLFGEESQAVLGASTDNSSDDLDNVEIIEVQPGVYKGRLIGQPPPGLYDLFIQLTDLNGNLQEQKIAEIRIAKPFTVYSNSNQPLEGAKITLYSYSPSKKDFVPVTPGSIAAENPTYSLSNGTVNFVLPPGKYKADVRNIGYTNKQVLFTIGVNSDYPQIYLSYTGFNLLNQFEYYSSAAVDFYQATVLYVSDLTHSIRFFELTALITVFLFCLLLIFSLSERMHVPVLSLPFYFLHYAKIMTTKRNLADTIRGRVYDKETKSTVSGVQVFLLDARKNQIVGSVTTNTKGEFKFLGSKLTNYAIQVVKVGYEPVTYSASELKEVGLGGYLVNIEKQEKNLSLFGRVKLVFEKLFSLLFEVLFIATFVFELALTTALPLIKVLPFLLLSFLTLVMWLIHMTHLRWSKTIK